PSEARSTSRSRPPRVRTSSKPDGNSAPRCSTSGRDGDYVREGRDAAPHTHGRQKPPPRQFPTSAATAAATAPDHRAATRTRRASAGLDALPRLPTSPSTAMPRRSQIAASIKSRDAQDPVPILVTGLEGQFAGLEVAADQQVMPGRGGAQPCPRVPALPL